MVGLFLFFFSVSRHSICVCVTQQACRARYRESEWTPTGACLHLRLWLCSFAARRPQWATLFCLRMVPTWWLALFDSSCCLANWGSILVLMLLLAINQYGTSGSWLCLIGLFGKARGSVWDWGFISFDCCRVVCQCQPRFCWGVEKRATF